MSSEPVTSDSMETPLDGCRRPGAMPRPDLDQAFAVLCEQAQAAVVYGASPRDSDVVICRTHNPRAWKSYESVAGELAAALQRLGFHTVHLLPDGLGLPTALVEREVHLTWLNTGGVQGHAAMSHAASALESAGVFYVGHGPLPAALMDDKSAFKTWLWGKGLPTAPFFEWHPSRGPFPAADNAWLVALQRFGAGAMVIKPVSGRASQHVICVSSPREAAEAADEVFRQTRDRVLVEPFLPGRELCIAVGPPLRREDGRFVESSRPVILSALERRLDPGEKIFTSMDERPIVEGRIRILDEATDPVLLPRLKKIATKVFDYLRLGFLIRLDLREDRCGNLMILEANPKPDLMPARPGGSSGLIALGLEHQGLTYDNVIACQLAYRVGYGLDYCRPALATLRELLPGDGGQRA